MGDRYRTFSELARKTREGTHWRVLVSHRDSPVLIAAPHGGRTEPHTDRIARAIAGKVYSLYVFEARKRGLHVTSHRFTEPRAVAQAARHRTVVTVHGCDDRRSRSSDAFVGGLDFTLRDAVIAELRCAGFKAAVDRWTPGTEQANICNAGASGAGVQLELTRRLRNRFAEDGGEASRRRFALAVRKAIRPSRTMPRSQGHGGESAWQRRR
jgi:phage replication-related protein YjqB (UPF0714/DUF867 family)